jgi:hypothetical protein
VGARLRTLERLDIRPTGSLASEHVFPTKIQLGTREEGLTWT